MKTFSFRRVGRVIVALAAVSALAGCAVYTPAQPAYAYGDGGPVYAAPAYVGPPVSLSFGFGSWWGGRGHYRRGYGHGGWHRGRW